MALVLPSAARADNRFPSLLVVCALASIFLFAGLLHALGVSLIIPALFVCTGALLWLAFRQPLGILGSVLAFMPVFPLTFLIAKFFGPSYIGSLEGCDRVALLLLVFVLLWRNGLELAAPDWFLLACFGLAALRMAFGGTLIGLLTDFNFVIAYFAGRVTVLSAGQEQSWAKRAVWIVAVLAVLGMFEVFVIGEGPRTLLYLSAARGGTSETALNASFRATEYSGLRESSTMFGPLQFAPLCMAALILWWVYSRKPLPGAMIAAGLVCTVTRSAWVGTILALSTLAIMTGKKKQLGLCAAVALALFVASIPVLGLGNYLSSIRTGEEPSASGHQESILEGFRFASEHPFGVGPGNVGRWAVSNDSNGFAVENSYLTIAAEYGIVNALCFIGFLLAALRTVHRLHMPIGFASVGILVGFSVVMMIMAAHDTFSLACWIWFPIGQAIRSASTTLQQP